MSEDLMNPFDDDFDTPMDNFFGNLGRNMFRSMPAMANNMRTDVTDDGKAFHVTAELPGFKKNNIHLDYRNNTLRIGAKHNLNKETKNEKGHVIRRERSNSNVERAFRLPNVDFNKITASYERRLIKSQLTEAGS
ncbi:MAG: Hsp20/alpha crystallin family protein [Acetilactobacillus jinshanensis]